MIGVWQVFLYNKTNSFQAELPFSSISITKKLNDIWTANATIEYSIFKDYLEKQNQTVDNILSSGFRWADIKRNGVTVFKGILVEASLSRNGNSTSLQLSFKSWLAYFAKRFTSNTYTSTDAGDIAWGIINTAQGITDGSIGITSGTITATKQRDRTFNRDEIAKSIINMSAFNVKDGYDFEISDEKIFTVSARLGSDKPAIVFDNSNIRSHQITYLIGLNLVTQSIQLGNGIGVDQKIETRTALSTYTNKWYLQEKITSNSSVSESTTLQDHGDKELALYQDQSKSFDITVDTGVMDLTTYNIGDGVTVKIEDVIDGLYRIKQKEISVRNGDESVKLTFI